MPQLNLFLKIPGLSLLVAAALLSVAWATPCTDICFGTCDIAAETHRIFLPLFGAFVQPNLDFCRSVCSVMCNCVDTCQGACGSQLATCRDVPSIGFFHFIQCQVEFTACGTVCSTLCSMSAAAGALDRVSKTLLPPPEEV